MSIKERINRIKKRRDARRAKGKDASRKAKKYRKIGIIQRRIVKKQNKKIDDLRARAAIGHGPAAAVKWALSQVGVHEIGSSNWGVPVSDWIKASGYSGPVPWCQCFVNAAATHGGAPQVKTGYTPTVLAGSIPGYKRVSAAEAKEGDFVFFKFPGVSSASCDHVGILTAKPSGGMVDAVEGNTSSNLSGSQNNGGGVYHKTRSMSLVAGFVRPPYKN